MKKILLKILLCVLFSCSILFCFTACNQTNNCQHSWQEVVLKEATCSEEGVLQNICTLCGDNKSELLPKKAHSEEVIPAILEDCANSGLTEGKKCSVCDEIIVQQEIVSATGLHSYNQGNCIVCQKVQCEGLVYTLINEGTAYEVTSIGNCKDKELIIPSIYNNLPVISIGQYASDYNSNLIRVIIPNTVTNIGNNAFEHCTNLLSVTLGEKVNNIGSSAFEWCRKLLEVYNLSTLNIKVGGKYSYGCISYYARDVYSNLQEPSKLSTDINGYIVFNTEEDKMLMGYSGIEKDLVLPNEITKVYSYAFYACFSLTSIEINEGVTYIGPNAFESCSNLINIFIPEGVTGIGSEAFSSCYSLTNIQIPNSVTSIGDEAFDGCTKLLVTKNNVQYVSANGNPYHLLVGVTNNNLSTYTIDNTTKYILSYAFYKCSSLINIEVPNSIINIGYGAFIWCSNLTSIEIGNNVTNIADFAFKGCSNLTRVIIGNKVTSIGASMFYDCSNLERVIFEESSKLESISDSAFANCTSLTSITIPKSVTRISDSAFRNCIDLERVIFEENSKLESIGDSAFYDCSSLTSITIPNSVTKIGGSAFFDCDSLDIVYYGGTATEWWTIIGIVDVFNSVLTGTTRYYYIEKESDLPADSGKYWHYVNGVPTIWPNMDN